MEYERKKSKQIKSENLLKNQLQPEPLIKKLPTKKYSLFLQRDNKIVSDKKKFSLQDTTVLKSELNKII